MKPRWLLFCLLLVYLATGIFQIKPGEWALVCRFGKPLQELRGPGLHWGLPWGLDQVHRVAVDEQRRLVVGYLDEAGPDDSLAPLNQAAPSGHLLTGDNQMINLRVIVLYRVQRKKLAEYVQQQHKMEDLLQRATEEVMTKITASQRIDHLLTGRTAAVESAMADNLRERMAPYNTGVLIDSVNPRNLSKFSVM
ncbi:MAG TPA: SPFH domain-containing protein [Gemmatales bacterium]|nr:SPFH domain-containing protein [Gemmatales bacterium]